MRNETYAGNKPYSHVMKNQSPKVSKNRYETNMQLNSNEQENEEESDKKTMQLSKTVNVFDRIAPKCIV